MTGETQHTKTKPRRSLLGELKGFFIFIFTGCGFGDYLLRKRGNPSEIEQVVLYQFHTGIYLWLWIVCGFICGELVQYGADSTFFGWLYIWVVMYTLITVLFDVSRNIMLIIALVFGFLMVSGLYLQDHIHIPVLTGIYNFFAHMNVRLDPGFAKAVSWLLIIPFGCILVQAYFDGRIRITSNEIEVFHYGNMTESISRVGKKVREKYRDLNETVLGLGAADMVVIDYNGHEERVFENVVGLRFHWPQIDRILQVWDTEVKEKTDQVMVQS